MRIVFHGSVAEISTPLVSLSRPNLDFGPGFYLTELREQAEGWARRIGRRRMTPPVLNIYNFDFQAAIQCYRHLRFEAYDKTWLDFIVSSRSGKEQWRAYDIIEGGVANDRVIDTVEDYMRGRMSAEAALVELSKHQPNNQICILNQEVADKYLHFVESINIQDNA